jgi:hypothetical protein
MTDQKIEAPNDLDIDGIARALIHAEFGRSMRRASGACAGWHGLKRTPGLQNLFQVLRGRGIGNNGKPRPE